MSSCAFHRKRIHRGWVTTSENTLSRLKETVVEPKVISTEVVTMKHPPTTTCAPCRIYTKGTEKPSWATHGCPGKGHQNKITLQPQLPAEARPKRGQWPVRLNGSGFSCIHPECRDYKKIYPKKQNAQQHAKKHYPPEYRCAECEGEWYLKTEYNQHFLKSCRHCGENFMKGSIPGHEKKCLKNK
jgi:hypothetical protein